MSTLTGRPNTALLVVDAQNGVLEGAHQRDDVVARLAALVERARAGEVPVVWVQHQDDHLVRGEQPWRLVPELLRTDSEAVVHKRFGDSFEDTDLESVLDACGIGRLVVAGAQTDECIRSTIHGAFTRGYDVTLAGDAHTTEDLTEWGAPTPDKVIAHTNLYWGNHTGPGRTAEVRDTADITF